MTFELKPTNGRKSFYGKALIKIDEQGCTLQSYLTDVARIEDGHLIRLWDGYSVTTMTHINEFCKLYNLPTLSKKQWESIQTEEA